MEREGSNADRAILVGDSRRGVGVSEREWNCAGGSGPHIPAVYIYIPFEPRYPRGRSVASRSRGVYLEGPITSVPAAKVPISCHNSTADTARLTFVESF